LYWIVIVRCWLPTLDTYILCKCNCLHFPWCCEVQTSVAHVKTTNLIDLNNSICNYLLWCQKGICLGSFFSFAIVLSSRSLGIVST
jgi:hypothetical protein